MDPKLIIIPEKKCIGKKSSMHHGEFENIVALWKRFMPHKNEIQDILNSELIAIQVYNDFNDIEKSFDIYASVEVSSFKNIPEGMMTFTIPEGNYAVFTHKGMDASATYQRIMTEWLPNSGYEIDTRPHFQVMGVKYKNGSDDSEEDFYVPVKFLK